MSNSKLKTKIKNLVSKELSNYGFTLISARLIERNLPDLIQGIEFQPGSGHLKGKYTLNIYWRFNYLKKDYISFDAFIRLGELLNQNDIWFSRELEIEEDFEKVKIYLTKYVLPYLEKFESIEKLVNNYENKKISKSKAFGTDIGWQFFNLGFSYILIGEYNKGLEELNKLVNEYSKDEIEWVQYRKLKAQNKINEVKEMLMNN